MSETENMNVRNKQCKACPWKMSTVPERDIPNGYNRKKHCGLSSTIAKPGDLFTPQRLMACHESKVGAQYPCVGWLMHQLGPGNNLPLRILGLDGRFNHLALDGEQHNSFEATIPEEE